MDPGKRRLDMQTENTYVYDLESYPNCFIAIFKKLKVNCDGEFKIFTLENIPELKTFLNQEQLTLIGYNNFKFDDPIIRKITQGKLKTTEEINEDVNHHINLKKGNGDKSPLLEFTYNQKDWISIDLMEIIGEARSSLKYQEIKLGMDNVVDLPFSPGTILNVAEIEELKRYCKHDINATEKLYWSKELIVKVRKNVNLRYPYLENNALHYSDPKIAEEVIIKELTSNAGFNKRNFRKNKLYEFNPQTQIHRSIQFIEQHNIEVLEELRKIPPQSADGIKSLLENYELRSVGVRTKLTTGGMHAHTGSKCIKSSGILNLDVTSFYPNIIKKINRSPVSLPEKWVEIYGNLVNERESAKQSKDKAKADVYKIIINSIYGKFGDLYSINYDPSLLIETTLNGQLYLMMLIELMHEKNIDVIMANTDGIFVDTKNNINEAYKIVEFWEKLTDLKLEIKEANIFVILDSNNYALHTKESGWNLRKGIFSEALGTKPRVIPNAVLTYFENGVNPEHTINNTEDLKEFLFCNKTKNNFLHQNGNKLQSINRWYKSQKGSSIVVIKEDKNEKNAPLLSTL